MPLSAPPRLGAILRYPLLSACCASSCMTRLPHRLLRTARSIDSLLPLLLQSCRNLPSARNELRWLREHLAATKNATKRLNPLQRNESLRRLCLERSRGKPLQYIIGDQPFGDLEILCRPGVLIPRFACPPLPPLETYILSMEMDIR